ncbi:unnamed protein product [Adineta steineri]|uniref:Uncharacterized protein n=1 Tax=Adineta steineri TaxID=433720 RepID=A0A813YP63_9BILA|nr:unnamed protein product [Adineta steineri]CAF1140050.1 unnamed protein product [Adineta steineri]CAF3480750.1 unnamed protein product [Adineta steineri]CAF3490720.1 unnamed protein product [Adineta steineri]
MSPLLIVLLLLGVVSGAFKPAREFEIKQGSLLNNGRSYTITDTSKSAVKDAEAIYTISNDLLSLGKKLVLLEKGQPLYELKHKLGHLYQKWNIYDVKTNENIGTLRHRPSIIHDSYKLKSTKFGNFRVSGNIGSRTFSIKKNGHKVAEIQKKLLHVHDTYRVQIEANQDPAIILLLAIGIDEIRKH